MPARPSPPSPPSKSDAPSPGSRYLSRARINRARAFSLFYWAVNIGAFAGKSVVDPIRQAFAGAGALGFEAASRGAAKVWMIERDAALVGSLKRVQERLSATSVQVEAGDGVAALQRTPPHSWNLIFLDPPYDSGLLPKALAAAQRALAPAGLLYLESAQAWPKCLGPQTPEEVPQEAQWALLRHLKAGQVHAHLLRPATLSSDEEKIP